MNCRTLVIGYGNTLRRDDGVGVRIARRVAQWGLPSVATRAVLQLTPELAADMADAARVLFIDATCGVDEVTLHVVQPNWSAPTVGHAGDPSRLLGWSLALYGAAPRAWLLTVPAYALDVGERLSPQTAVAMRRALGWLRCWVF